MHPNSNAPPRKERTSEHARSIHPDLREERYAFGAPYRKTRSELTCWCGVTLGLGRWGDDVVYEGRSFCYARCRNREAYHRVEGVTVGCTEAAEAFCNEGDRGGLTDAMWSQCDPS